MHVDQRLVNAAIELAEQRYAGDPDGDGWAGAVAMYASDGRILSSVFVDAPNLAASRCCETGAIAEAHKLNLAVTASVCVSRERSNAPFLILTPCGICQERLAHWGGDVEVAVPHPDDSSRWLAKPLREVQPYYWRRFTSRPGSTLLLGVRRPIEHGWDVLEELELAVEGPAGGHIEGDVGKPVEDVVAAGFPRYHREDDHSEPVNQPRLQE